MREPSHDELRELIAPYAIGAVAPEEDAAVRSHLRTCDECRAEADSYAALAPRLALSVDEEPLPDGFVERLMSRAKDARSEPTGRRSRFWPAVALGATALVIAALALAVVDLRGDLRRQQQVSQGLLNDDALVMEAGEAKAAVVPTDDGTVLVASGMEAAPRGRTYQLWFVADGEPASGGVFEVEDGLVTLESDRSLEGVDGVAVTLEPTGGSDAPTTEPVMASS